MYIFFDVDGVLNKKSDWNKSYFVDENCVKVLKRITELRKDTKLVICSSWREGVDGKDNLSLCLKKYGLVICDRTPLSNKTRQEEIEYYIKRNKVKEYLIIDDDISLYPHPERLKLYCPNYLTGLTKKDVKKLLKML